MTYHQFNKPDTWNGFRDIDEKINFEELRRKLEEGDMGIGNEALLEDPNAGGQPTSSP